MNGVSKNCYRFIEFKYTDTITAHIFKTFV